MGKERQGRRSVEPQPTRSPPDEPVKCFKQVCGREAFWDPQKTIEKHRLAVFCLTLFIRAFFACI